MQDFKLSGTIICETEEDFCQLLSCMESNQVCSTFTATRSGNQWALVFA